MAKKPKFGECKLCGKYTVLTYEHVPPKSAFNNTPVKQIGGEEILNRTSNDKFPWDLSGLRYKKMQKGSGGYYLCHNCNENTGSWYVPYFERFVKGIYEAIYSSGELGNELAIGLGLESIRPLPIFKEIMVMFCDINHGCFGDEKLRAYLLQKDSDILFNSKKYRVFCYIAKGPLYRTNGLSVTLSGITSDTSLVIKMSEIITIPLGFVLYIDLPDNFIPVGCEITAFSQFRYEDETKCEMTLPLLESNTVMSGDYRKKEEVENTIKQNEIYMKQSTEKNAKQTVNKNRR